MFSNAMNTIESAISTSMRGGNQSPVGAKPRAEANSVIECAAVNDVITAINGRIRGRLEVAVQALRAATPYSLIEAAARLPHGALVAAR